MSNQYFPWILILLVTITSCQTNENSVELTSLNESLLRGEIALCGDKEFGEVDFPFSCGLNARKDFNLAISLLHSFEYDEAEKAFVKVVDKDPKCTMAYWGIAMCNFHALWRPPTVESLRKGSLAIKIARSIKQKTSRESAYIEAIGCFYDHYEKLDHKERVAKFEHAMESICQNHPDDMEAAILYTLALNAGADLKDKTYKSRRKAGAILEELFSERPNHPGIAHYLIHSYDYPELAELALPAARRYASIAPSSAHAQHMPSHIFTRLGLWQESILSNLEATSSARCYAEQVGMSGNWDEEIHGVDYLVYAYLQTGEDEKAKDLVEYVTSLDHINPIGLKAAYPAAAIPARYYLETRQWEKAKQVGLSSEYSTEEFPWPHAIIHFSRALGSAHLGELNMTEEEVMQLHDCREIQSDLGDDYLAHQIEIMLTAAKAWLQYYKGKTEEALTLMSKAAEMEKQTEKQSLTPGELLPAQELMGDLLMAMKKYSDALLAYEENLLIRPYRLNSLFGAAQAAQYSKDHDKARLYYQKLIDATDEASKREAVTAAQAFLHGAKSL